MTRQAGGVAIFCAGAALMALAVVLGEFFLDGLGELGMIRYEATQGPAGILKFLLFALGFPLGAGLAITGAALFAEAHRRRAGWFALAAIAGAMMSAAIPAAFGRHHSPAYFGVGGVLIAVLVVVAVWFWGGVRARLPQPARAAADLKALGYLCFALAAWNLCGVGGMPGFALYPQKMLALEAQAFAVGQMKVVMAFFVLGWTFTALGWRRALVQARQAEST